MRTPVFASCRLHTCTSLLSKECTENTLCAVIKNVRSLHNCNSSSATTDASRMRRNIGTSNKSQITGLLGTSSQCGLNSSILSSSILCCNQPHHATSQIRKQHFQRNHTYVSTSPVLHGVSDRYRGVWVDFAHQKDIDMDSLTNEEFGTLLSDSLCAWRDQQSSCVWLTVPVSLSRFIAEASTQGFHYHHAEGSTAVLYLWMLDGVECKVPQFGTHQVGVSGIVLREDTDEVLAVQDKNRKYTLWKFPGGLSDLGEDIGDTAVREVFEETGVHAEFQSIIAFRQQHLLPGAFGRSDLFYLCRLKPLTFELNPCADEIKACEWMSIERLCHETNASSITHRVAALMKKGMAEGFHTVDITNEKMQSIHKGLDFYMFHRPL